MQFHQVSEPTEGELVSYYDLCCIYGHLTPLPRVTLVHNTVCAYAVPYQRSVHSHANASKHGREARGRSYSRSGVSLFISRNVLSKLKLSVS